jgi:hypothetical protein
METFPLHFFPLEMFSIVARVSPTPVMHEHPRIAMGSVFVGAAAHVDSRGSPMITAALFPPNPKEFDRTVPIRASRD